MIFFLILIVLVCVAISLFILVQNPKGGGLAGTIAGFNSQFMGVKQTTDVLEKGTWILATILGILCLVSSLFISDGASVRQGNNARPNAGQTQNPPASNPQPGSIPPSN